MITKVKTFIIIIKIVNISSILDQYNIFSFLVSVEVKILFSK